MSKKDALKLTGIVTKSLPGTKFIVNVKNDELCFDVNCSLSGKLRKNSIKILENDKVDIEVSVYDLTNGRIVWRYK